MIAIESGDVLAMQDETFADLLDDLNEVQNRVRLSTVLGILGSVTAIVSLFIVGPAAILSIVAAPVGWGIGKWMDSYRRAAVLFYELDEDVGGRYESVTDAFDQLNTSAGTWHQTKAGQVDTLAARKRNSGASHLVQRNAIAPGYRLPSVVKSNITPPVIPAGKQALYFFPDVLLVEDGGKFGAIGYRDLELHTEDSLFIEDGEVPSDAEVVDYTWKHPNKNGGPDRRFNNNHQIPVCRYDSLHLKSVSGLNELFHFSRRGVVELFEKSVKALPSRIGSS
jgi:hypothetical protein